MIPIPDQTANFVAFTLDRLDGNRNRSEMKMEQGDAR